MALLAGAGPQLRVEPSDGDGQRDERVQAVPPALQGGTRGHTGAHRGTRCRGSYLDTKPFTYWAF